MSHEITLRADLPEIAETPIRIEVRCGETTAYVYEHGHQGSGAWAVWRTSAGGSIVAGGTNGYTQKQALSDAREHVRREERSRLLHQRLRLALAEVSDAE